MCIRESGPALDKALSEGLLQADSGWDAQPLLGSTGETTALL